MAVFNKDKPDYLVDDQKNKGDFDSLRYYNNRDGGNDQAQYQLQNGYGLNGYGAGQQNALQMAQQRQQQQLQQQQQQQMSLSRGQSSDYSILNLGNNKPLPPGGFGGNQQGINNGSANSNMFPGARGLGSSGAPFDNSNFPMLGGGSGAPALGRNTSYGAGMYGGGQIRNDEDFTIEKEDFPALPGSHSHKSDASAVVGSNSMGRDLGLVGGGSALAQAQQQAQPAAQEYSGAFGNTPGFDRTSGLNIGGLIGSQGAGSVLSSIHGTGSAAGAASSANMSTEVRFGLAGLLDIIRMTDKQDVNSLALGTDLTTFGLNLNSGDSLFPTFASPFTDQALTPDPQFRTPACYMMHPPSLKGEHLSKFQLETLFYMFYSMPKDILQACAAQELYRREWRFHGELKVWLKPRAPHELMQSHPSVMFAFFDVATWETRLFTTARGPGVVAALLCEEEVRVKVAPAAST